MIRKREFCKACSVSFSLYICPAARLQHSVTPVDSPDYRVELEIFEGPLDLLLYLIKRDEVDIYDVSIDRITKQYMAYLDAFKMLNIELASEFVVMAANLLYIKSRTLLPKPEQPPAEDADDDDPRWDFIRQLVEYKKFKDAASFLSECEAQQQDIYAASPERIAPENPSPAPLPEVSIFDLIRAFKGVVSRFEASNDLGDIVDDRFTVSDKIDYLLDLLPLGASCSFDSMFESATSKSEVIVTFLAVLELMKMNQFAIHQDQVLGQIEVMRKRAASSDVSSPR